MMPLVPVGEIAGGKEGMIAAGPFGSAVSAKYFVDHGTPMIRGSNLSTDVGVPMVEDEYVYLPDEVVKKFPRAIASAGDLIFTCWGTIGQVGWISPRSKFPRYLVSNKQMRLRPNPEICDAQYLYYFFASELGQAEIMERRIGSSVPGFNLTGLRTIKVPLPPLPEQRAIAATLGALDDKIELNRRMNETLEAMARALFRDWFVDFGPTRAKMAGQAPYLSPALWDLFPANFDDEGKPEGWTSSTIGQEVRVVGGSTPSTTEAAFWDGTLNWATPKDLSNLTAPVLLQTARKITNAGLAKISSGLLPIGTVLLSSRAPIGYLAIAELPVAINQGFIAMICDKRLSNVFVWLWTLENMVAILSKANGSTFLEISKGNFRPLPIVVPDRPIFAAFDALARPLFARIAHNERETRTLAQTRDLLLPRLMSGELRVSELEGAA